MTNFPEMIGRRYFETEKQAENYLVELGYEEVDDARFPWSGHDNKVMADIRFNSIGIFIDFRTR